VQTLANHLVHLWLPLVDNYRFQYAYFVDIGNPEYQGSWNAIHNRACLHPRRQKIQTANSDTP